MFASRSTDMAINSQASAVVKLHLSALQSEARVGRRWLRHVYLCSINALTFSVTESEANSFTYIDALHLVF